MWVRLPPSPPDLSVKEPLIRGFWSHGKRWSLVFESSVFLAPGVCLPTVRA
jgi:hypothetical protein